MKSSSSALRIFLVEDHEDTLTALLSFLRHMGHQVSVARSMHEALAAMPECQCDVLISDIGLPDGTGWELMERLREKRPPFAIAMSGFGMVTDRARSKEAGFRHHLVKPADPDQLDELLDEASLAIAQSGEAT